MLINKSFRPTRNDIIRLQWLVNHDSRYETSIKKTLYYAFQDAAEHIPDWNEVSKLKFNDETESGPCINSTTISFAVEEDDFTAIAASIKNQLGLKRINFSYMTRLCILAARNRIAVSEKVVKSKKENIIIKNLDAATLLLEVSKKTLDLLQAAELDKIFNYLED